MRKFIIPSAAFIGFVLVSGALAESAERGPHYLGQRSADPEQETYGYVHAPEEQLLVGFVGPARSFGAMTGDAEKDTVAYRPLFVRLQDSSPGVR